MFTLKQVVEGNRVYLVARCDGKTFTCADPSEAVAWAVSILASTPEFARLLAGKPRARQCGIIFGIDVRDQFYPSLPREGAEHASSNQL